jgi:signal transduction histidine kinase
MTPEGLVLDVLDDGGEAPVTTAGGGVGLPAIRRRLELIHGDAASFSAGPVPGGYAASLLVPARYAS